MNTGDRNTKGRAILKGPRGGLYVIGPSGTKLSTFTKAAPAAPAAPAHSPTLAAAIAHITTLKTTKARLEYARSRANNFSMGNIYTISKYIDDLKKANREKRAAKKAGGAPATAAAPPRAANTVTYKGSTFHRTNAMTSAGVSIYKKGGVSTWYKIGANGVPSRVLLTNSVHRGNGVYMYMKNYTKIPAPAPAAAPMTAALKAAIAHISKLKTAAGRARHVASMRGKLSAANIAVLERRAANMGVSAPATEASPTTTAAATPRITTAERNRRLAAIRARLNAMRAAKLAAMPKRRANVEKRLKNAVARVRTRLRGNNPTTSTMTVPFCHAPASVPRKACTIRKAVLSVYNSPMVKDGTTVATRASDIDLDWFKRQDAYVKNLSDYDFWTAQAHTNRSHSWIGPFLYKGTIPTYLPGTDGKHMLPLWPQIRKMILDGTFRPEGTSGWVNRFKAMSKETDRYNLYNSNMRSIPRPVMKLALEMYRDDLKRIIAGAPKSRKKMILYRGASFDIFRSTRGHWHTLESFCSAAYDLKHALGYEGGTMQRITVLPGTPVLLVAGMNQWNVNGEYEIMVNLGTKYLIRGRGVKRILWTGYRRMTRVTDVTIAK
jgi:hypothetical protein